MTVSNTPLGPTSLLIDSHTFFKLLLEPVARIPARISLADHAVMKSGNSRVWMRWKALLSSSADSISSSLWRSSILLKPNRRKWRLELDDERSRHVTTGAVNFFQTRKFKKKLREISEFFLRYKTHVFHLRKRSRGFFIRENTLFSPGAFFQEKKTSFS